MSADTSFTITSSPIPALFGDASYLVGAERQEDGALRVYVSARYRGIYFVLDGEAADRVEAAWNGSSEHLFILPVPPLELLHREEEAA